MEREMVRNEVLAIWSMNRRLLDDMLDGHRRVPGTSQGSPSSSSKPGLGFPTGTGLVLLTIFTISALFSCCYHWQKMRSRGGRGLPVQRDSILFLMSGSQPQSVQGAASDPPVKIPNLQKIPTLPVVMPGDDMPKFVAWPCPHATELALRQPAIEATSSNNLLPLDTARSKPS